MLLERATVQKPDVVLSAMGRVFNVFRPFFAVPLNKIGRVDVNWC